MTIDEAIEILSMSANQGMTTLDAAFKDAEKLGIEALKTFKFMREHSGCSVDAFLPGETKE